MADTYLEITNYTGTNPISIHFPYLDPSHIEVTVNGVVQTLNTPTQSGSYEIHGTTNVVFFLNVPSNGDVIRISRVTPSTPLVDWRNQTAISGGGLDNTVKQPLYVMEEVREVYVNKGAWAGDIIGITKGGTGNATGRAVGSSVDVVSNTSSLWTYYPLMQGGALASHSGNAKEVSADLDLTYIPSTPNPGGVQGNLACPTMTASTFANPSDSRIKKDVEDSDLGLSFVESLRPVRFKFKQSSDLSGSEEDNIKNAVVTEDGRDKHLDQYKYGFIAQELKESIDLFATNSDVGWSLGHDSIETVSTMKLVAPLVKAVQELSQMVEELEARILQLESN